MRYEEICEKLSGIREEWELCKDCEYFTDNGDTVTCNDFLPMKFAVVGPRTWRKNEPVRFLPTCKHRIEFLVLHHPQDYFSKRDFDKCRCCANFRNFEGHENLLDRGRVSHGNGEVYSCLCDPDNFYLSAFDKDSFINFGFAGHCNFKPEKNLEDKDAGKKI